MDPHLVPFVPENSSKNLESYIEQDNSCCGNDIKEPKKNGKLSQNLNNLKSIFVTTVKEVSASTKPKEDDAQDDVIGPGKKEMDDSTDMHIDEHVNQIEGDTARIKLEDETAEDQSTGLRDNFEEESKEEGEDVPDPIAGDSEDQIAGEHYSLLAVPDATHLSSQASLSSLHLQRKQVGKNPHSTACSGWGSTS